MANHDAPQANAEKRLPNHRYPGNPGDEGQLREGQRQGCSFVALLGNGMTLPVLSDNWPGCCPLAKCEKLRGVGSRAPRGRGCRRSRCAFWWRISRCRYSRHGEVWRKGSRFFTGGVWHLGLGFCQLNESNGLPSPDRDRPLIEAFHDLAGCLRPSGPHGEIDEWSIYDESLRRLVRWAEEAGCFFENLQPLKEGGREHDLTFIEQGVCWLKFTKPAAAGYLVSFESGAPALEPSLPLEYLERLIFQNELFADTVSFVGVGGDRRQPRIITRQPHLAGEAASREEIVSMMVDELGFRLLPERYSVGYADSLAFLRDDVAVFDLRPANVVRTPEGLIAPIDAIPARLDARARAILGGASI